MCRDQKDSLTWVGYILLEEWSCRFCGDGTEDNIYIIQLRTPPETTESSESCSITLNINNTSDYQSLRLGSNWRHLNQNWKKWRQHEDNMKTETLSVEGNKIGYFEIWELWDHEVRNISSDLFHLIASDWNVKVCLVKGGLGQLKNWPEVQSCQFHAQQKHKEPQNDKNKAEELDFSIK